MKTPRVLISGYYGFGNTGDEAILASILAGLATRLADVSCVVVSGDPAETRKLHDVEAVSWLDLPGIAEAVRSSDLVVLGGGGLFQDHWGVDPDTLLTPRHYGITFYAGPVVLAAIAGKPLALHGLGFGPLSSPEARRLTRGVCEAASYLSVRDEASRDLLVEIGVDPKTIVLSADPAFLLRAERIRAEDILMATGVEPKPPVVGVALRPWSRGVDTETWERELAGGLDRFLEKTGGTLLLVPFQKGARPEEDDVALAARVRQRLRHAERAVSLAHPRPAAETAGILAGCDLVVAMRLHGTIFAASGAVPSIGVAYDPKVSSLQTRLGLDAFTLTLGELTAGKLLSRMTAAHADRERLRRLLAAAAAEQRRLASEDLDAEALRLKTAPAPPPMTDAVRALCDAALGSALGGSAALSARLSELEAGRKALEGRLAEKEAAAAAAEAESSRRSQEAAHLERRAAQLQSELASIQTSRLWKLANVYWTGRRVAARLSRPARRAARRVTGRPRADWVGPNPARRISSRTAPLPAEPRYDVVWFPSRTSRDGSPASPPLLRDLARSGHRVFRIAPVVRSEGADYTCKIASTETSVFDVSLRAADPDDPRLLFESLDRLRREESLGATASVVEDEFWMPAAERMREERGWPLLTEAAGRDAVASAFPRVSVIVVTFDNRDLNRLCLESLRVWNEWPNLEVIVVDNASTDGTRELLKREQRRDPSLRVIENSENRGFAAACNSGLSASSGDYLVLLNNDTVVPRGALAALVRHLSRDPELGLVGPVTNAIANEARVEAGYAGLEDLGAWVRGYTRAHDGETFSIPMLALFCAAMPRAVFENVGLLDERFGIGMFEDDDYSRRVREKGYAIRCARDAFVHHWQMASFRKMPRSEYEALFDANRRRYEEKWGEPSPARLAPAEDPARGGLAALLPRIEKSRGAVVFLPSIGWDIHLFQRPHHLARVLARRGHAVVFDCSNAADAVEGFREVEENVFLYRGPAAGLHEIPTPLLWTFPYNYHLAEAFPAGARTVYDWIDELEVFPYDRKLLEENHARALRDATLVTAVARRLHERALSARPDALYVPNGVELERFATEGGAGPPHDDALAKFLSSGGPVAGYYGALASWFDYGLLDEVARLRPEWRFVLIGPKLDNSLSGQPVLSRKNVVWLGPRDYPAIPSYLSVFDVATIPFRINEITLSTSPLKLFEYFAGGKPVVTTPMPECRAFPEVAIAGNAREFADAIDRMREKGRDPTFRGRLREIASQNTWDVRVDAVLDALSRAPAAPPTPPARPASPLRSHQGVCNICGRTTEFYYSDPALYRESLNCAYCLATSRYRSIARGLLMAFRELAGVEARSLAGLPRSNGRGRGRRLSVYDTQTPFSTGAVVRAAHPILRSVARRMRPGARLHDAIQKRTAGSAYPIPDILESCRWIDLKLSTFRPNEARGRRLGRRTTNQTLERLTFPDGSFDIVVTSDVMEHVRLEEAAHREVRRVLRPGGIYLFTVPHFRNAPTQDRVRIVDPSDPSRDVDVLEREYHGDANSPDGRALAYRSFGIDLDEKLRRLGFQVEYTKQDFPDSGILNTELFFCRVVGSPEESGPPS